MSKDKIVKQWILNAKLEAKAEDGGPKRIKGYAATYEIDSVNDKIAKGAFGRTIDNKVLHGKTALMVKHLAFGADTQEAIGMLKMAREDDYGLYIEADLYDTQLANETYEKIAKSPNMYGLSIGYSVVEDDVREGIRFLTELKLYEVTVTMVPVNEGTLVNAKSEEKLKEMIKQAVSEAMIVEEVEEKVVSETPEADVTVEGDEAQAEEDESQTLELEEVSAGTETKSTRYALVSEDLDRRLRLAKAKF